MTSPNGSKTIKQGSTMNKKVDTHYGLNVYFVLLTCFYDTANIKKF